MAQRAASCSTAMAEAPSAARSHSMAIAPLPAPTSQRRCPPNGMRRASVAARTSRLVSIPPDSNVSSGSPGVRARIAAPGSAMHSMATVFNGANRVADQPAAMPSALRSAGPSRCSNTQRRLGPKPPSASMSATASAVAPSRLSTTRRAPGAIWRRTLASGRLCALRHATPESGQPSRAHTRLNADGAGRTRNSLRSKRRTSISPTPKHIGSPLASTTTRRPRSASRSSSVASSGRAPAQALAEVFGHHREMAFAADQELPVLHDRARRRAQRCQPGIADADHVEPRLRAGISRRLPGQRVDRRRGQCAAAAAAA